MKLLTKELLLEFGFQLNELKSVNSLTVMSKENFNVVIEDDGICYYLNQGIQYPVKDLSSLKKLYKESTRSDLNSVTSSSSRHFE